MGDLRQIDYEAVPPQERPGLRSRVQNLERLGVLVPVKPDKAKIVDIIWLAMDDPMRDAGEVADKVFAALGIGGSDE